MDVSMIEGKSNVRVRVRERVNGATRDVKAFRGREHSEKLAASSPLVLRQGRMTRVDRAFPCFPCSLSLSLSAPHTPLADK